MATVYIQKEKVDHIVLNNDTGADLAQFEFTVIGELCLVADEKIVDGETGSFHVEANLVIQSDDLETGEDTFATVNQDVYWNPSSGDFSDTENDTYYKVGTLKTIKDSDGMIVFVKDLGTRLDSALDAYVAADIVVTNAFIAADVVAVADAATAADITNAALIALGGRHFHKTATLTAAAANTPVHILTDAEVGTGVAHIATFLLNVNGGTAWTDSTGTIVTVQDTDGTPTVGITAAKAQLAGNALLNLLETGITVGDAIIDGTGFTAAKGLDIAADSDFDAGDDIIVTISGVVVG